MQMSTMAAAHLNAAHIMASEQRLDCITEAADEEMPEGDEEEEDDDESDVPPKADDSSSSSTTASLTEKHVTPSEEVDHSRRGRGIPDNLQLITDEYEAALAQTEGDFALEDDHGQPTPRPSSNPFNAPVTQREYTYAICVGVLLSFNAGYVNGSCLTGLVGQTGRQINAASNTGTITLAALALAEGDVSEFGFLTANTLSFLFGSFLAGLITKSPKPFRILPSYGPSFLLGAACLTLSSIIAALEGNEKFIFHLASAAAGIQNGISSLYSENLIRSTGFTGTTTDIGIFFGQFLRGNRKNTWKLVVMLFLLVAFWLGGLVSLYATTKFGQFSLLVNAILFVLIGGGVVAFLILELDVSLGAAILGTWQWKRTVRQLQAAFSNEESVGFQRDDSMNSEEHIDALFDQFDMDNSGTIDRKELHAALKIAGIHVSKRQSAQMVKRADCDGDGTISRKEWHKIVSACQDSPSRDTESSRAAAASD